MLENINKFSGKKYKYKKVTCENCTNKISLSRYKNQKGLCDFCDELISEFVRYV